MVADGKFNSIISANSGGGKIRIIMCRQDFCPLNSTCLFEDPEFEKPYEMYCLCFESGNKVSLNGTCLTCKYYLIYYKTLTKRLDFFMPKHVNLYIIT